MSDIGRIELFGKLNPLLYQALEGATAFCKLRGNPYVELVHWVHQILHAQDSDLHRIARAFELDLGQLQADLTAEMDRLPAGAGSVSDLSEHIDHAVERAWVLGSLRYGATRIRSGHLLAGLVRTYALRHVLLGMSPQFSRIVPDKLLEQMDAMVQGSPEAATATDVVGDDAPTQGKDLAALERFAVDLTAKARAGEIDPVSGRDEEIRQIVDVLMRRRQNNPLLAGEAGVGKTAVVEGLALRLAAGDVPPPLRDVSLYLLDIGLLQAGAGVKGEFEQRLRSVIDEVQASVRPIVLFIDEIHTLVGAGGAAGTGDAANLLKPALARGQLRTIGATTWSEYKKHIEKDPALSRRFQVVQVHEPDEARAFNMLRGLAETLQAHHGVLLLDEAITAAVSLSHRYIPARQLPDKAVALLDTACARVAISQHAVPPALEDARRRIQALETALRIARHEVHLGAGDAQRVERLKAELAEAVLAEATLASGWETERELAAKVFSLRETLNAPTAPASEHASTRQALASAAHALVSGQGEAPMIHTAVDAAAVAAVVADWTGIPVGRMVRDEAHAVLALADTLEKRVIGQRDALEAVARRIQTSRARLTDPGKPVGVFLLCGPSGVGKTETALALAEALYGGEQNLITINMSEFQESHTVSTLKGAPPGYVGYGEGGVLTEAVRRRPYCVVLLDEVEKAHPDVHEIFFQVFDKGWMEDGEGRYIDFRNAVIILTSNVGTERIAALCRDPALMPDAEGLAAALREPLLQAFPAALLGRLVAVPYLPLSDDMLARIVDLQFDRVRRRLQEHHGVALDVAEDATALVVARCTEVESGARMVDAILTNTVLPQISRELLGASMQDRKLQGVRLSAADGEFRYDYT
ncbi:protein disaggregation chaperone [Achromobacter spanius]|uniref:type VI secretion system ATPase TssH n=1 Tax=Achromobacter spanius TaxID=217203 RepID=UPI000C2BCA61|nr:type VI secretion system ATPase TssH [Achromobacter spanius]AUA55745.1 type VI secretion system ATPase TssH [Achromobacter spanius]CAB3698172.1 Protein ClpV1 [Achromobacter spanius]SPT36798.1 protein disaggregation chaperone [Achromobacter denitrificans]VEE56745.1 protein disaggregation chaperone [Achromobacter spanius]